MLDHFLHVVQDGYQKYPNAYHNHCHAAEVLQTVHFMLMKLDAAVGYNTIVITVIDKFLQQATMKRYTFHQLRETLNARLQSQIKNGCF